MKQTLLKVKEPKKYDFLLLSIIIIMAITSIVGIYSAFELIVNNSPTELLIKQVIWFGLGFIAVCAIIYLGNDAVYSFAKIAYWILLAMLLYLLISKEIVSRFTGGSNLPFVWRANGATSWFLFPAIGTFQPSEFMKIVLILITARIIDEHNSEKVIDSYESDIQLFIKVLKWALPPLLMIYMQPDTGVCLIIFASLALMVMCSGIKPAWIYGGLALLFIVVGGFLFLYIYHYDFLSSFFGADSLYKLNRIKGWLDPESDIQNTGTQLYTALMAMGSAGLTGHGLQQFLVSIPEAQTDFIFAVIGQSFGLIGTLFVVGLCLALDLRLLRIATLSKVAIEKYFICGVLGMLLFQQVQNIGMIVGLLPITGITLPFISAGGSSLLSYFLALGVIVNASSKAKKLSDYIYE